MQLVLQFLGLPQLHLDDQLIATDRRKAIALLAYLAVNDLRRLPQRYSREALSALLWPDYEQAKAFTNLRRMIWDLRQDIGTNWLVIDREAVQLNVDAEIDLDVAHFQDLLSQARGQTDVARRIPLLIDTVKLYRNHFLTGFSLKDAYPFNEWAYTESEELRGQLTLALTLLVESYCMLKQAEYAIPYARRLITLDPLNESAHRQLMEVYLQAGQPNAALKQYQTCEQLLRKELNLDPQPETRTLYKKVRKRENTVVATESNVDKTTQVKPKHNLPVQLTTFVGREKESDEICNLLTKNRLVTLIGAGGIGKTRLALQAAQTLLSRYSHGVWLISFDSLAEPTLVPQTIASTFDIREGSDRSITDQLIAYLYKKSILLILDNCEHLLEACAPLIDTLLKNCPDLKILATSREVIGVEGELIYTTPALSLPDEKLVGSVQKLTQYESIRLFSERAALTLPTFTPINENASVLTNICRSLDGIPLAIELAAARVDILQVHEILGQLKSCFDTLASSSRTVLPRHQTMRASMDWSWGLLSEAEQKFMQQLSVFAGGWTLEMAGAVCDGDTLNATSGLVKKSLIVVDQTARRETRYRFHEIVRQYAREKLIESGKEEHLRTRHLKYFLRLSEQAELALRGPLQMEWYARLDDEHDNLRAALRWADKTDAEAGLYLSGRLDLFWFNCDVREGLDWLTKFLLKPASQNYPTARAKALCVQAQILNVMHQFSQGRAAAEECLALYRACTDQRGEVDGLLTLGGISSNLPQEQKVKLNQQALALAQSLNDQWREAIAFWLLGWDHRDIKRAFAHWAKAIVLIRQLGDRRFLASWLSTIGYFHLIDGDLESAQKLLDEAKELNDQLHLNSTRSSLLSMHGQMALMRGDYEQARAYVQENVRISDDLGTRREYLWAQARLGYIALREGGLSEAHEVLAGTAQEFLKDKNEIGVVFSLEGMIDLLVTIGKPERAARLIGWADATRKTIGNQRPLFEQGEIDRLISACLRKMGEVAFSDAYDEGQKMSLAEAVAYVLER